MKDTIPVTFQSSAQLLLYIGRALRVRQRRKLRAEVCRSTSAGLRLCSSEAWRPAGEICCFLFPSFSSRSLFFLFSQEPLGAWKYSNPSFLYCLAPLYRFASSCLEGWRCGHECCSSLLSPSPFFLNFLPSFSASYLALSLSHPAIFCPFHFPLLRHFPLILSSGYPTFFFFVLYLFLFLQRRPSHSQLIARTMSPLIDRLAVEELTWRAELWYSPLSSLSSVDLKVLPVSLWLCGDKTLTAYFFSGTTCLHRGPLTAAWIMTVVCQEKLWRWFNIVTRPQKSSETRSGAQSVWLWPAVRDRCSLHNEFLQAAQYVDLTSMWTKSRRQTKQWQLHLNYIKSVVFI